MVGLEHSFRWACNKAELAQGQCGSTPPGQMDPFLLLTSSGLLPLAGPITQEQRNTAEESRQRHPLYTVVSVEEAKQTSVSSIN